MPDLSSAEHLGAEPQVEVPRQYNAAYDLIERNLMGGRADQIAFVDDFGALTYRELAQRVDCFASGLRSIGVEREDRILLCLLDTNDWPVVFLGAIKAGVIPVLVGTRLTQADYDAMLRDSRAKVAFVSRSLFAAFDGLHIAIPSLARIVISEAPLADRGGDIGAILEAGRDTFDPAETVADEPCFWIYSSGAAGAPKATIHCHGSLIHAAELHGRPLLGLSARDRTFSSVKLASSYGLCNSLVLPMAVGATSVLMSGPPTPEAVCARLVGRLPAALEGERPTVFFGVPTLYAAMLASDAFPSADALALRVCVSAGEALPAAVGERFTARTGLEILDGLGSTEMLYIFLSNRRGHVRYGTTGVPVPGYRVRLVDEEGRDVPDGTIGDLLVDGPTAALGFWNQREQTRAVFLGRWTRCGDRFLRESDGRYRYAGRSDDILKVGGESIAPIEVETALLRHDAVGEAAVIGHVDADGLTRPKAYVVPAAGTVADDALAEALKRHVARELASFKAPHRVVFVDALPHDSAGGVDRKQLRDADRT